MRLKNIKLEIVYDNAYYEVLKHNLLSCLDKDFFLLMHFDGENGYIYIDEINEQLCSKDADSYLWHPSVKLFHNDTHLDSIADLSLLVNINIKRLDESEDFKAILYGDIEYFDATKRDREFSLIKNRD